MTYNVSSGMLNPTILLLLIIVRYDILRFFLASVNGFLQLRHSSLCCPLEHSLIKSCLLQMYLNYGVQAANSPQHDNDSLL